MSTGTDMSMFWMARANQEKNAAIAAERNASEWQQYAKILEGQLAEFRKTVPGVVQLGELVKKLQRERDGTKQQLQIVTTDLIQTRKLVDALQKKQVEGAIAST